MHLKTAPPCGEIKIPSTVKVIDNYIFDGCTNLEKITLTEGVFRY